MMHLELFTVVSAIMQTHSAQVKVPLLDRFALALPCARIPDALDLALVALLPSAVPLHVRTHMIKRHDTAARTGFLHGCSLFSTEKDPAAFTTKSFPQVYIYGDGICK